MFSGLSKLNFVEIFVGLCCGWVLLDWYAIAICFFHISRVGKISEFVFPCQSSSYFPRSQQFEGFESDTAEFFLKTRKTGVG